MTYALVDGMPMLEEDIQMAVFAHLRERGAPGVIAWHPKNGGVHQASVGQRVRNAKLGVLAGIQDVHVLKDGKLYCLELKRDRGKVSQEQQALLHAMSEAGAICGLAYGLDEALWWLEDKGLLRGQA